MIQPTLTISDGALQVAKDLAAEEGHVLASNALAQGAESVVRHGAQLNLELGLTGGTPLLLNIAMARATAFLAYVVQAGPAKPPEANPTSET